jgi:carbon storage regulator
MLILTRKTGQGFRIGEDIEVTITEVLGDKVRVGIEAPKEIKVLRSELTETMAHNMQAVTRADVNSLKALARGMGNGKKTGKKAVGPPPSTQHVNQTGDE